MVRKKIIYLSALFIILFMINETDAQKYFSRTGEIAFFSKSMIENIEAKTNSASTVLDYESGKIQWAVLIKSFEFEKALMQEHFNENYMESSKFPKAKFTGVIQNIQEIDLTSDGEYEALLKGTLEIHGIEKEIEAQSTFKVENSKITASSILKVLVADYNIKIPSVVKDNIAKEIEIKIDANYEKLDKS